MRNFTIIGAGLFSISLVMISPAIGANDVTPNAFLMDQIRLGEASNKDDLVRQSLARLILIDPDNPDVIAAQLRLALRQGDQAQARQHLEKLHSVAPDSEQYRQSAMMLALTQQDTRQKLEQARLQATAGRYEEAKKAYDELFHGEPPTLDLAVEYWRLVARLPGQEPAAIQQLEALDKRYPGNVNLRLTLARRLFSQDRDAEGYALLEKLADDPVGRGQAAGMWMEMVKRMVVSPQSVARLNRFITVFADDPNTSDAQNELDRQQKMLNDPAYQARQRGIARVEQGASDSSTLDDLNKALAQYPNDPNLIGALGMVSMRNGDRTKAIALFEQAQTADINRENGNKWESLIKSTRYWQEIDAGNRALNAKNVSEAEQHFQQAQNIDNTNAYALSGLGDVAAARGDDAAALRFYQQALQLEADNGGAIRGITAIYARQSLASSADPPPIPSPLQASEPTSTSPESALPASERHQINTPLAAQQKPLQDAMRILQRDITSQQAEQLAQQGRWREAEAAYQKVYQPTSDEIWLPYHYAQVLRQLGKNTQADAMMQRMANTPPISAERAYAYALYLSSAGRGTQALAHLRTLPETQWDEKIRELAQRLSMEDTLAHAQALYDAGNETGAVSYLQQQPANTRISLMLADWALQRGNAADALTRYHNVLAQDAQNADAQLGEVEALIAIGQREEASQRLQTLKIADDSSLNTQRRIANAWYAVGNTPLANQTLQAAKTTAQKAPASQIKAWIYRDAARLETQQGQSAQAQADYRQAMVASGISSTSPQDNDSYTRLTRPQQHDDWLQRSIRADAADQYRQQDINVTLGHDYWRSSGTNGISNLKAHNTVLQADFPLYQGRGFVRTDTIAMNAGRFNTNSNGAFRDVFGTCATLDCYSGRTQKTSGTGVAAGWKNDRWTADIGTTPIGFEVVDVVGGVSYSGDWQQIGWTATASRRPISSSLLAFGGAKDPITGTTWGGVRATGASLGLSYDRGEAHGVWSDLSFHQITGKNVADNHRARAMAGYYYKLINEDNRRLTVGANTMWWSYQKDLSGYSLGQGGYYSPQQYVSFGLPINYRQRTENWSWELGGTVSWSYAKTKNQRRYPLGGLVSTAGLAADERDRIETGSSSTGFGYTLRALLERRLTSHWTLGAAVDIQQAKDYTPSHGMLYLRYSFAGWQGSLDSPPQPPTPYSDFK